MMTLKKENGQYVATAHGEERSFVRLADAIIFIKGKWSEAKEAQT